MSSADGRWHPSRAGFYLPVRALSRIFRAKFRAALIKHGLFGEIPEEVWAQAWNVHCQAAGDGRDAVSYLAHYVFKVAIAESRIVHVDDQEVRFRYHHAHSNRERTMTLPIFEFMRRFLQHVLPRGFMKVRYYGFLSPSSAMPWEDVKARIEMASGFDVPEVEATLAVASPLRCRQCGGVLRFCRVVLPGDSALPALSSRAGDGLAMLTTIAAGP